MQNHERNMSVEEMELTGAERKEPASAPDAERPEGVTFRHVLTWERVSVVALILIVALGAYFRFTGLNWDDNHHLHPDERFLTDVANNLETVTNPLTYLRTSQSPLNPYNLDHVPTFVYGNFPMTVTRYVAEWVDGACDTLFGPCQVNYTGYDGIHLVGRFLSGLVDLASLVFAFLIGRRLYDWRVGVLGALLFSVAVMPIQQSHFFTMDNWAAALSTVAVYMAVRAGEAGGRKRWWVLFGLFLGLAVASRINVAPLAAISVVAAAVWLGRRQQRLAPGAGWQFLLTGQGSVDLQRVTLGLLVAAAVALFTFRLAHPYAFVDGAMVRKMVLEETGRQPSALRVTLQTIFGLNPQWLANMEEIQGLQSPEASFPPALQWTGRAPLLFPLSNMVLYGMGLTAGIAAVAGFFWAFWRIVRGRSDWTAHALPVAWAGGYFLFMGVRWVKSIRYFLPIYPFLLLLAGWALVKLWDRAGPNTSRRAAVGALVVLTLGPALLWANAFTEIYEAPLTRIEASRWMFEDIPSGATLLYEADGQEQTLHLPLKGYELRADSLPLTLSFSLPQGGTVTGLRFNYVSLPAGAKSVLNLSLVEAEGNVLQQSEYDIVVSGKRQAVELQLEAQTLPAEAPYALRAEHAGGGPIMTDTSRIVNEEWDDLLPVNVDDKAAYASYYSEVTGGQRPLPWPANEEKRRLMLQWLDEADVIALSSQRSLWSTPRLPLTYPLNIAYYRSLFDGELGFELAAQFHADLHIGPLYISDTGGKVGWGQPPRIGWPPPGELAAEEAFSVYDHPPVWIFRKTASYSSEQAARILNVDLNNVVVMNPGEASNAPNGLMLTPREREIQTNHGTFSRVFDVASILSQQPALAAIVWWASTVLLGWLAFPIAYVALGGLPQRGYALSRILGLLLVSWVAWFIASYKILPHDRALLWLSVLFLFLMSSALGWRHRQGLSAFARKNLAYVGFVEAFGLLLFLVGIAIRLGNPDVWDVIWGGEKPMDLSYFTAVVKSTTFPPYDPWFAGGYINYYYYGFVFVGFLTELLGIVPTVAYNLILPTLFSLTGVGVFSVAYNLAKRLGASDRSVAGHAAGRPLSRIRSWIAALGSRALMAGVSAALLCVFLGNLGEVGVVLGAWQRAGQDLLDTGIGVVDAAARIVDGAIATTVGGQEAPIYPGDWFWTATRAINVNPGETAPITEFPFFTFLYGDLHAHMIALPLTVLALAWAVSLALGSVGSGSGRRKGFLDTATLWFAGALSIGVLRATNTWDWPTYLFLGTLAVVFRIVRHHGGKLQLTMLAQALVQVVGLAGLSTLLFWPYVAAYGAGYESLRLWEGSYTHVGNYLVIYGLFLFIILTFLAREFRSWSRTWTQESLLKLRPFALPLVLVSFFYVVLIAFLLFKNYWIAPSVLTLVILSGVLGLRPGIAPSRRVLLVLVSAALGLTLLVEVVVLEGDIGRMNTVFKFYMQVWVLLSVAAGVALAYVWPAIRRRRTTRIARLWQGTLALLVAAALLYPLLAVPARWRVRMSDRAPYTLDGMAFMETTSYGDATYDGSSVTIKLDGEYEALRWMQRHVEGTPVVAEASPPNVGEAYRSIASRVAVYTGLPLIIGWDWHQTQQRAALPGSLIRDRMNDVDLLYSTPDRAQAMDIIDEYRVQYIYIGTQESLYYPPEGLEKFARMADAGVLRQVFSNDDVTIYEVVG